MTVIDLLALHGIKTVFDIDRLKGSDSRYGYLVKNFGEVNADRVMRIIEVRSWDFGLNR